MARRHHVRQTRVRGDFNSGFGGRSCSSVIVRSPVTQATRRSLGTVWRRIVPHGAGRYAIIAGADFDTNRRPPDLAAQARAPTRREFLMKATFILLICVLGAFAHGPVGAAEALSLPAALGRVLADYEPLQVAARRVERARQEQAKVESTLGWVASANSGVSRDLSFVGSPTNRFDAGAGLERRLAEGSSVAVTSVYTYEDASAQFSPLFPDPAHSSALDLNYRKPLRRGVGNPDYAQGLVSADAGVAAAAADRLSLRDQVAAQVIELYYAAALTRARRLNAAQAIERARRLKTFVQDNTRLGVSEEKDLLQAEAQLRSQRAEHTALRAPWEQQRTALNRLMGRPWDAEFRPAVTKRPQQIAADTANLFAEASAYNPALRRNQQDLRSADAELERVRDARKDTLDVLLNIGTRTLDGDAATTDVDEADLAGGVGIEYRRALDQRGFDAQLYQAQIDRRIVMDEGQILERDLRYELTGLLAEHAAGQQGLRDYRRRLAGERAKFDEALGRYRTGRTDTSDLIRFENELLAAQLAFEQQRIELDRLAARIDLLRGSLWQSVPGADTLASDKVE